MQLGHSYIIGCIVGARKDEDGSSLLSPHGREAEIAARHAVAVFIKIRLDSTDSLSDHPTCETIAAQIPDFDQTP